MFKHYGTFFSISLGFPVESLVSLRNLHPLRVVSFDPTTGSCVSYTYCIRDAVVNGCNANELGHQITIRHKQ